MKKITNEITNNILELVDLILKENPLHRQFINSALDNITDEELQHLATYINFCLDSGLKVSYLAECYLTIVEDTLTEQIYFKKNKEYRYKSFNEVADKVYFDEQYMNQYMYGLALSSFLWPNHVALARFFKQTLPHDKKGRYLEVGPGHGYYLITAMQSSLFDNFLGIDISETSVKQTQNIVEHFLPKFKNQFQLKLIDFLAASDLEHNKFDAIVMGEVLEHVEQPENFLRRISELAKPDAYIYITTCINAPAIDHIYLWRNKDDLENMIRENGLNIIKPLYLPYEGKSLEESIDEGLAVNIAYVLGKT